jgi:hypothetical protein
MNMCGMGCALYIRCALSIHQKECQKVWGARYLPENTLYCKRLAKNYATEVMLVNI